MIDIIPAILPRSFEELEEGLRRLHGVAPLVQIDLVGENFLAGKESIPFWQDFDFEFDIMLPDPAREVEVCVTLGASRIVVHANAASALEAVQFLQQYRTGDYPLAVGIALEAHDMPSVLDAFENLYDYVQVMGIDHIGRQGEPPDPHHHELLLIAELRTKFPKLLIQVDGAVAPHPRELVQAGASRLVVGSAIVNADNPKEVHKALYTEANVGQ